MRCVGLLVLLLGMGCGPADDDPDAGPDEGSIGDAARPDRGRPDAAPGDLGPPDGGPPDGAPADAAVDRGGPDGDLPDAAPADAGPPPCLPPTLALTHTLDRTLEVEITAPTSAARRA